MPCVSDRTEMNWKIGQIPINSVRWQTYSWKERKKERQKKKKEKERRKERKEGRKEKESCNMYFTSTLPIVLCTHRWHCTVYVRVPTLFYVKKQLSTSAEVMYCTVRAPVFGTNQNSALQSIMEKSMVVHYQEEWFVILPTVNMLIRRRGHYNAWKLSTSLFPDCIDMLRLNEQN